MNEQNRWHPRAPGLTLREAFRIFTRVPSARIMAGLLAAMLAVRIAVGDFSIWDGALVLGLIVAHPLSEWLIHVFVLHFRPREIAGRRVDFLVARLHRAHHRDPHDPRFWYIPAQSGLIGFVIIWVIARILMPTQGLAVTVLVTAVALGLVYEWIHYLCHTSYRPQGRWFKKLARHHRLHHFKNEHYWMGVSMHGGDWLLRTRPDPGEVETSPTCRDLLAHADDGAGGDAER